MGWCFMSEEKDSGQVTGVQGQTTATEGSLAVEDVIVDEGKDIFSEYLSVSITNNGQDTTLSATTVQGEPVVYTTTFHGITADDFQTLLSQSGLDTDLG